MKKFKKKIWLIIYYSFVRYLPNSYTPVVGKFCNKLRIFCVKKIFYKCGNISTINRMVDFGNGAFVEIGDHSGLGENCVIPNNIVIKKRAESIYKETPYAFKAYMKLGEDKYYLPYINYGISNDTCYIYNIVDSRNDKHKEIESEYNTKLLSLSLFMKELYNYGIGKIKVVSCLPMREEKNDILNYFMDMEHIFKNVVISTRPFEYDEYMNINISEFDKKNKVNFNELIFEKE